MGSIIGPWGLWQQDPQSSLPYSEDMGWWKNLQAWCSGQEEGNCSWYLDGEDISMQVMVFGWKTVVQVELFLMHQDQLIYINCMDCMCVFENVNLGLPWILCHTFNIKIISFHKFYTNKLSKISNTQSNTYWCSCWWYECKGHQFWLVCHLLSKYILRILPLIGETFYQARPSFNIYTELKVSLFLEKKGQELDYL